MGNTDVECQFRAGEPVASIQFHSIRTPLTHSYTICPATHGASILSHKISASMGRHGGGNVESQGGWQGKITRYVRRIRGQQK